MPSILFVCTGNLYRSPLLAALFYRRLQATGQASGWIVGSAGTWATPGIPAPSEVRLAAQGLGVDLQGHVTRLLDEDLLTRQDLVLVMERGQREALNIEFPFVRNKLYLISEVVDQQTDDIPDPLKSGRPIVQFAAELAALVERGYRRIYELAQTLQSSTS
jgi:protein-tyrosine phosphatase